MQHQHCLPPPPPQFSFPLPSLSRLGRASAGASPGTSPWRGLTLSQLSLLLSPPHPPPRQGLCEPLALAVLPRPGLTALASPPLSSWLRRMAPQHLGWVRPA
eukprot:3937491-Rhodomonas_salina.1